MIGGRRNNVNLFFEIEVSRFFDARKSELARAIESASKEQLDEHEAFSQELLNRFSIEPLRLDFDGIYVSNREEQIPAEMHPRSGFLVDHMRGKSFPRQVITFHLPYSGTAELLRCRPNPRLLSAPEVSITDQEILFDVIDFYSDPDRVKREADQTLNVIKKQAQNLDNNVSEYNAALTEQITELIQKRREQLQSRSKVMESLGYPVKVPEEVTAKAPRIPKVSETHTEYEWDVFISYASEDKEPFVRDLANELSKHLRVWYDEFTLTVGDSLRQSIDKGLARSRYGVVVLSHNFFRKEWPQKELDGLATGERDGRKVILPIWLNIDVVEIRRYSPLLADRVAVKASEGLDQVVAKLLQVLKP